MDFAQLKQTQRNINTFLVESKQQFCLELFDNLKSTKESNLAQALALQVNLESYGYAFSRPVIDTLSHLDDDSLSQVWQWFNDVLPRTVGAHRVFKPMYPNFPKQVIQASDLELLINAYTHYMGDWLGVRILPVYKKEARLPLVQNTTPKVLHLASLSDVDTLTSNLLNANSSLSETQKSGLKTLLDYQAEAFKDNGQKVSQMLSNSHISQKETQALVGAHLLGRVSLNILSEQYNTVTDVLRLAVGMSGGDISLAVAGKFRNFKRSERRALLGMVELILLRADENQALDNAFTHREQWLRLTEKLHPGEFAKQFEKSFALFNQLRNSQFNLSYNSQVDRAFEQRNIHEALELLVQRPGVFARNLNRLFQQIEGRVPVKSKKANKEVTSNSPFATLKGLFPQGEVTHSFDNRGEYMSRALTSFEQVSAKVSTPVLLQVMNHFKYQDDIAQRTFLPKGVLSKSYVMENTVVPLSQPVREALVSICENELISRFAHLPALGETYVDSRLQTYNMPFAMRSASKALKTLTRGSRIDVGSNEGDTTRFFIWWHEHNDKTKPQSEDDDDYYYGGNRVDIDLSVVFLDEQCQYVNHCSFTRLRGEGFTHSGDITSAPNGACEFIDIDRSKLDSRIQYAVMVINSFTHQAYCDLPECFAGWMNRDFPQKGEIFDAKTVQNKIDLTSDTQCVLPMIVDVKSNQAIWADVAIKGGNFWNMVEHQNDKISYATQAMLNLSKPNLYDLFMLHAKARGQVVDNAEQAQSVFSVDKGVTPFDLEVIAAQYMADPEKDMSVSKKPKL
jgi:stress response protein SCP2